MTLAPSAAAQSDRAAATETCLRRFASNTPGLQYVVVSASDVLVEYAGGSADLHRGAPMSSSTTQMAYSMSKTVTAVAALQLVEHGRLTLDDPVARHVEALPYGEAITVRQLIAHTSGVPNPIPLRWVHAVEAHATFDEHAALAAVLRAHPRLSSPPGVRYRYSNLGYWLLGRVVEQAGGLPFVAYVRQHILDPLGFEPGELGYAIERPENHATGYLEKYSFINLMKGLLIDRALVGRYSGSWLEIRRHHLNGPAFGGLVGTARAFGRLLQDQLRDRSVLFGGETRARLYAPERTRDGRSIPMTLGWHIGELAGARTFYKEGGGGGFHCMMRLYPTAGIGTVLMTNATGINVRRVMDTVDPVWLSRRP